MGIPYGWRTLAIITIAGALAFAYFLLPFKPFPNLSLEHLSSPYVKVIRMGANPGHGSGTYLGNGFILTANHVIKGEEEIEVVTEDGKRFKATVKSTSDDADIAVLKIDPKAPIQRRSVACRPPQVGESVTVTGNPYDLAYIQFWGRIAGKTREISVGQINLKGVMILDITVTPGVSGAAVIDRLGKIIGTISATLQISGVPMPVVLAISSSLFCEVLHDSGAI